MTLIISDTGHVQPPACQDTLVVLMFSVNVKKFLSFSQEKIKHDIRAAGMILKITGTPLSLSPSKRMYMGLLTDHKVKRQVFLYNIDIIDIACTVHRV